jgi:CMP/dCMP kinase
LGSGGAYVGQQLAKRLNIFYADREIIDQAAKQFSLLVEDLEAQEEKIGPFWDSFIKSFAFTTNDTFIPPQKQTPTDRELFEMETDIIRRIANEQSAVIIGRCGCHILQGHPKRLSIYLHSDMAFRKERIQKLKDLSEKAAEKVIVQSDKARSLYYQTFTGKQWADTRQYDLSINTGKIGLDKSVELVLQYLDSI